MTEAWPDRCPRCNIALIVNAPFTLIEHWPETIARYGFRCIGMTGGWENLGLDNSVRFDDSSSDSCDGVYLGDLITPEIQCPRCGENVFEVVKGEQA